MFRSLIRSCKNAIAPKGSAFRTLRFGIASGCVIKIDFRDNTGLYFGIYEKELEPYLRALLRPGYRCFDVGGQGGYDALVMAKLTNSHVISMECLPEAAEAMRDVFARNRFQIQTYECFVGNGEDGSSMSLDVVACETFTPDFIKIDIEGAEVDALEGARSILATRKPHLVIEVHGLDKEIACLKILREYGYEPQTVDPRRWFKDKRVIEHNRWLICRGRDETSVGGGVVGAA
ncbi:MAG: hypothetical protein QOI13_329 [Paraburkholderia sp.]|jgi:hypothetical protein|nr:hypothetical protein [Paraburkholderia sp.]